MESNHITNISLDDSTGRLLMRLVKSWRVSKEEALRRALEQANSAVPSRDDEQRIEIFHDLQRRLSLTPAQAATWQDAVRETRR